MRTLYGKDLILGFFDNYGGLHELHRGRYELALQKFNVAISANPKNFFFYERRACANLLTNNIESALSDTERFLEMFEPVYHQKTNDSCLILRFCCFFIMGQAENALSEIEKTILQIPQGHLENFLKGIVLAKMKRHNEAVDALLISIKPPERYGYYVLPNNLHSQARTLITAIKDNNDYEISRTSIVKMTEWRHLFRTIEVECYEAAKYLNSLYSNKTESISSVAQLYGRTCSRCQMEPCHCSDPDLD